MFTQVAVDLSHIDTPAQVEGFLPPDGLPHALKGADIVVIPAGESAVPLMQVSHLWRAEGDRSSGGDGTCLAGGSATVAASQWGGPTPTRPTQDHEAHD